MSAKFPRGGGEQDLFKLEVYTVLQSPSDLFWGRESCLLTLFVFLVSRGCCVPLPHDATGLSAVCDCGIS